MYTSTSTCTSQLPSSCLQAGANAATSPSTHHLVLDYIIASARTQHRFTVHVYIACSICEALHTIYTYVFMAALLCTNVHIHMYMQVHKHADTECLSLGPTLPNHVHVHQPRKTNTYTACTKTSTFTQSLAVLITHSKMVFNSAHLPAHRTRKLPGIAISHNTRYHSTKLFYNIAHKHACTCVGGGSLAAGRLQAATYTCSYITGMHVDRGLCTCGRFPPCAAIRVYACVEQNLYIANCCK